MSPWLRASGLTALTLALCLAVLPALPGRHVPVQPASITTDTASYCRQLAERVDDLVRTAPRAIPADVLRLRAEGGRMCNQGQLRGGLMCLRRAVLLLRAPP